MLLKSVICESTYLKCAQTAILKSVALARNFHCDLESILRENDCSSIFVCFLRVADLLGRPRRPLNILPQDLQSGYRPHGVRVRVLETELAARLRLPIQDSFLRKRPQRGHRLGPRLTTFVLLATLPLRPCNTRSDQRLGTRRTGG